jgi:hypothetical protein
MVESAKLESGGETYEIVSSTRAVFEGEERMRLMLKKDERVYFCTRYKNGSLSAIVPLSVEGEPICLFVDHFTLTGDLLMPLPIRSALVIDPERPGVIRVVGAIGHLHYLQLDERDLLKLRTWADQQLANLDPTRDYEDIAKP